MCTDVKYYIVASDEETTVGIESPNQRLDQVSS